MDKLILEHPKVDYMTGGPMNAIQKHPTAAHGTTYRSVEELAAELGISRQSVYVGLRNGTIPSIRLGKRFILPRSAIADWLKSAAGQFKIVA
jgi:excisionase family DNA binding protein